jgi:hypothetical protein
MDGDRIARGKRFLHAFVDPLFERRSMSFEQSLARQSFTKTLDDGVGGGCIVPNGNFKPAAVRRELMHANFADRADQTILARELMPFRPRNLRRDGELVEPHRYRPAAALADFAMRSRVFFTSEVATGPARLPHAARR